MNAGLPIYFDVERDLVDPIDSEPSERDWQPGNRSCEKLFRCVEAFRDLKYVIESAQESQNSTKRRRRLKLLVTPLHSLATCVDDLLDDCIGNPDTRSKLSSEQVKSIVRMKDVMSRRVPFKCDGILARVRNKTAAHIDAALSPNEVRQLLNSISAHQLGFWMDVCVSIVCDLLKLPIYFWSCHSNYPNVIRLLAAEPILASFRLEDNEISEFVGAHLIRRSPRTLIANLVIDVVKSSRWLFRPIDPQIREFYYDERDSSWAQSLQNLD